MDTKFFENRPEVYDVAEPIQNPPPLGNVFGSAMRLENPLESAVTQLGYYWERMKLKPEPDFSPSGYIKGTEYEAFLPAYSHAHSRAEADMISAQIKQELKDRATVAEGGVMGVASMLAAGVMDPINLIPVGFALDAAKGVRTGFKLGAGIGFASAAATEGILQGSQYTRTTEESAQAVGTSTLLMGLLGGAIGKVQGIKGIDDLNKLNARVQQEFDNAEIISQARRMGMESVPITPAGNAVENSDLIPEPSGKMPVFGIPRDPNTPAPGPGRIVPMGDVIPELSGKTVANPIGNTDNGKSILKRIQEAYLKIGGNYRSQVGILDLRNELKDIPKEELDKELTRLYWEEKVRLFGQDDPQSSKPSGIPIAGRDREILWITYPLVDNTPKTTANDISVSSEIKSIDGDTVSVETSTKLSVADLSGVKMDDYAKKQFVRYYNSSFFKTQGDSFEAARELGLTGNPGELLALLDEWDKAGLIKDLGRSVRGEVMFDIFPKGNAPKKANKAAEKPASMVLPKKWTDDISKSNDIGQEIQKLVDQMEPGWGDDKVYIIDVYKEFSKIHPEMTLKEFKRLLPVLNREGKIALSRADLVEAMDSNVVQASETPYLNAVSHFIRKSRKPRN